MITNRARGEGSSRRGTSLGLGAHYHSAAAAVLYPVDLGLLAAPYDPMGMGRLAACCLPCPLTLRASQLIFLPLLAAEPAAAVAAAGPIEITVEGKSQVIDAGDKMIIVEPSGTIIIGGPEAVARAQAAEAEAVSDVAEVEYLTGRANAVQKHFASAVGADDFMQRVEMALYAFGFTGDNSIGEDGSHCRHACISSPDLSLSSFWAAPIPPSSNNLSPSLPRSHGEPVSRRGDPDPEAPH